MLIASRKVDRLNETANQMRKLLSEQSPAELHTVQCNIREEDEVTVFTARNSSCGKVMFSQVSINLFTGGWVSLVAVPCGRGGGYA